MKFTTAAVALLSVAALAAAAAPLVQVGFYYESKCPGCHQYSLNQVQPTIHADGLLQIMNLTVYPYGNAQESGGAFQCQHGPVECQGNALQACSFYYNGWNNKTFGFYLCAESNWNSYQDQSVMESCATKNGLDGSAIWSCSQDMTAPSGKGFVAENFMAQATNALNPPHTYVPWLVINGQQYTGNDMLSAVCNAYTGTKPSGCNSAVPNEEHGQWTETC